MDYTDFSKQEMYRILQGRIKRIEREIEELEAVIVAAQNAEEYNSPRTLMELAKKEKEKEYLDDFVDKIEDFKTTKSDKKIAKLKEKEEAATEALSEALEDIVEEHGNKFINKAARRDKEKLEKTIKRLQAKRGKIEAKQRPLIRNKIESKMRWQQHFGRVAGRSKGFESIAELYDDKRDAYNEEAAELYDDKKYIKGTEKKAQEFISLGLSKTCEFCAKAFELNNTMLQGAVEITGKAKEALEGVRDKIKEKLEEAREKAGEKFGEVRNKITRRR